MPPPLAALGADIIGVRTGSIQAVEGGPTAVLARSLLAVWHCAAMFGADDAREETLKKR